MGDKKLRPPSHDVETTRIASSIVGEMVRQFGEEMFVFGPQTIRGIFGGVRKDDSWGRGGEVWWMKAGPAWVKSGGDIWHPDEVLVDFGGLLTNDMIKKIAKLDGRIVLGSAEDRRWRVAFPRAQAAAAKEMLTASDIDFLCEVRVGGRAT